ncbi:MAG: hypothetical protein HQK49_06115 [Oligoflexia bacterium]|nr:hypothetical protein [Oligoflexia bacterium]
MRELGELHDLIKIIIKMKMKMNIKMRMRMKKIGTFLLIFSALFFISICMMWSNDSEAVVLKNRWGVGMSNQLKNDIPSVSLKFRRTEQFAWSMLFGVSTRDSKGGYGAGLKVYRTLFLEPYLNFYSSLLGAFINKKSINRSEKGFQFDGTLGTEFHFQGLHSIGFSFDVGVSVNKIGDEFCIETVGYHFIQAAVHFYI